MINRPPAPTSRTTRATSSALEDAGATCYRGTARIVGRGRVEVRHDDQVHELHGPRTSSSPSARISKVPPIPGLDGDRAWTNREATLARELPKSLLVLGGGPTGCELAQVYARFGVPTTIVQSGDRLMPDRASPQLRGGRRARSGAIGVDVRLGVRAIGGPGRGRDATAPT